MLKKALLFTFGLKLFYILYGVAVSDASLFSVEVFDLFRRNDSFWYEKICTEGYPTLPPVGWDQLAYPFFPLYPILVKSFMYVFGSFSIAAFALGCVLSWLWVWLGFKAFRAWGVNERHILQFFVLVQVFPFHYFFHVYYTELLFGVLLFIVLLGVVKNIKWMLFCGTILLAASRPTGVIYSALFIFYYIEARGWWRSFYQPRNLLSLWPFAGGLAGLGGYMVFLHYQCGDFLAFSHAIKAWGRGWYWPWEAMENHQGWEFQFLWFWALLLLVLAIWSVRKSGVSEKIFVLGNALFPLFTGNVISYYRYFAVIFPVFKNSSIEWSGSRFVVVAIFLFLLNVITWHYWVVDHGVLAY